MLTKEENQLLTRIGSGTPAGELLRRYWHPVGFVSEHVEVLYDLDVQAQERAAQLGIRFERPPTLNDDPLFMEALAEVIREKAHPWLAG